MTSKQESTQLMNNLGQECLEQKSRLIPFHLIQSFLHYTSSMRRTQSFLSPAAVWTCCISIGTATTSVIYPLGVPCLPTQAMFASSIRSSQDRDNSTKARTNL